MQRARMNEWIITGILLGTILALLLITLWRIKLLRNAIDNMEWKVEMIVEYASQIRNGVNRIYDQLKPKPQVSFTPRKYVTRHTKLPGVNESIY